MMRTEEQFVRNPSRITLFFLWFSFLSFPPESISFGQQRVKLILNSCCFQTGQSDFTEWFHSVIDFEFHWALRITHGTNLFFPFIGWKTSFSSKNIIANLTALRFPWFGHFAEFASELKNQINVISSQLTKEHLIFHVCHILRRPNHLLWKVHASLLLRKSLLSLRAWTDDPNVSEGWEKSVFE